MRDAQDTDVLTPARGGGLRIALPVLVLVVIADQITKNWALGALEPGSCRQPDACIDLFAGIKFHLVFNTGAAFTSGSGYGPVFGVLAFVMTGVLLHLSRARTDPLGAGLFGAIAGGAVGNLLDRLFRADDGFLSGAVIDFIDLGWWPVFNIADSAIVVGVVGVIAISMLIGDPSERPDRETDPEADAAAVDEDRERSVDPDRDGGGSERGRAERHGADGADLVDDGRDRRIDESSEPPVDVTEAE